MTDQNSLDLILQTRLDVLKQVAVEVNDVLAAMSHHRRRLMELDAYLRDDGRLDEALSDAWADLNDATGRFPRNSQPRTMTTLSRYSAPMESSMEPSPAQKRPLDRAKEAVESAKMILDKLRHDRVARYETFAEVRRWMISESDEEDLLRESEEEDLLQESEEEHMLREALADYRAALDRIGAWNEYENQLPRRGQELFSEYLELAGGMAVRGSRRDTDFIDKANRELTKNLLEPLGTSQRAAGRPSPLAVMGMIGRQHRPLGYNGWSLWALPLIGRTDYRRDTDRPHTIWSPAEQVVGSWEPQLAGPLLVLCTDLYAQHVIGPSYLYASMFLDFDPHPTAGVPGGPPDTLRAFLLLEHLPHLGGTDPTPMTEIAEKLKEEWQRARQVVGGEEPALDSQERAQIDRFFDEMRPKTVNSAYNGRRESDNRTAGDQLADPHGDIPSLTLRQLLSAMWHGRMQNPASAEIIHERAQRVRTTAERIAQGVRTTAERKVPQQRGS